MKKFLFIVFVIISIFIINGLIIYFTGKSPAQWFASLIKQYLN